MIKSLQSLQFYMASNETFFFLSVSIGDLTFDSSCKKNKMLFISKNKAKNIYIMN